MFSPVICSILHFGCLPDAGVRTDSGQPALAPHNAVPRVACANVLFRLDSTGPDRQPVLQRRGSGGRGHPVELHGNSLLRSERHFHASRGKGRDIGLSLQIIINITIFVDVPILFLF